MLLVVGGSAILVLTGAKTGSNSPAPPANSARAADAPNPPVIDARTTQRLIKNGLRAVQLRSGNEVDLTPDSTIIAEVRSEMLYSGITGYRKFDLASSEIKAALNRGVTVGFLLNDCRTSVASAVQALEKADLASDFQGGMTKAKSEGLFDFSTFHIRLRKEARDLPNYSGYFIDAGAMSAKPAIVPDGSVIRLQPRTHHGSEHYAIVVELGRTSTNAVVFDEYVRDIREEWAVATPYDARTANWSCPKR